MRVLYALTIEDGRDRPDGRRDFTGVHTMVVAPQFPYSVRGVFVAALDVSEFDRGATKKISLHLLTKAYADGGESDAPSMGGDTIIVPDGANPTVNFALPYQLNVDGPLDVRFDLRVDGVSWTATSLRVLGPEVGATGLKQVPRAK